MVDPKKKRYFYLMIAGFGAIGMSILLFFLIFRMDGLWAILHKLSDILAPFVYGGVVAYLLRPLCNYYEKMLKSLLPSKLHRVANGLAVLFSLVTGILVVYALIIMIAPQLYESIRSLWNSLPEKVNDFLVWAMETFGEDEEMLLLFNKAYTALYSELDAWAETTLVPYITDFVSGLGSSVVRILLFLYNLLIGLIVSCYLLASRKKFARQGTLVIRSAFSQKWAERILYEIDFIDRMFGGFIDGKILDSAIIGLLCYLGCLIFRFPNALLVSAFVGITNVIPFFGPFIGAIPSVFLILIEDPMKALGFAVFAFALQQLDGNVIGPAILGERTGLSSFWVLFSIILFGDMFGLVGMIIAVPLFAVIYDTAKRMVRKGLIRKGQVEVWEQYKADYPDEDPPQVKGVK